MGDFYESDEPVADIAAAFERSGKLVTGHRYPSRVYGCEHMTVAGPLTGAPRGYLCGCELSPVPAQAAA